MSEFQEIKLWQSLDGKIKATNEFRLPVSHSDSAPELGAGAKRWNDSTNREQTWNGTTWEDTGGAVIDDDADVVITSGQAGQTQYDMPSLAGVRYRLIRDGIILNSTQWQPLSTGGFELLIPGDVLIEGSVYTITKY